MGNTVSRVRASRKPSPTSHGSIETLQRSRTMSLSRYIRSVSSGNRTTNSGEEIKNRLDVSNLLPIILPFCPRRITEAFSAGFYHDSKTGSIIVDPAPRKISAALLLVRMETAKPSLPLLSAVLKCDACSMVKYMASYANPPGDHVIDIPKFLIEDGCWHCRCDLGCR